MYMYVLVLTKQVEKWLHRSTSSQKLLDNIKQVSGM